MNRTLAVIAALLLAPAAAGAQDAPTQQTVPEPTRRDAALEQDASAQPRAEAGPAAEPTPAAAEERQAATEAALAALKKLKLSGYVQGRWAWREAAEYQDGAPSQSNFFVRRGRLKVSYSADWAQYVVQLDATPSGVGVKEAFAELKLPFGGLAVDAGLQLMPFGYEVGVRSSADLDLLERSMASRSFLAGEYDLGVSLKGAYGPLDFRVGVFNGNGVDAGLGGRDNDQLKDVVGRVGFDLGNVTGGVSGWYGETIDYTSGDDARYDRFRAGADLQVALDVVPLGATALKGEFLWGRTFIGRGAGGAGDALGQLASGWYATLVQDVGARHQLALRYDRWTEDMQLDEAASPGEVFTRDELSAAVHTFFGKNLKLTAAWFHPMNRDAGPDAADDPKADSVVAQLQAKF